MIKVCIREQTRDGLTLKHQYSAGDIRVSYMDGALLVSMYHDDSSPPFREIWFAESSWSTCILDNLEVMRTNTTEFALQHNYANDPPGRHGLFVLDEDER
jgi:hypothetical protein